MSLFISKAILLQALMNDTLYAVNRQALQGNDLTTAEKTLISQPFHNYDHLTADEGNPNVLQRASEMFQQDHAKIAEMENVLARFAPPI